MSIFAFRIKKYVENGNHTKVVDPTTDKKWEKLKELNKKIPSTSTSTTTATEVCLRGVYERLKVDFVWTKDLEQFPIFTQREIIAHRNKSGKRKHQKEGKGDHSVAKTTLRGAHFKKERFVDADTIYCGFENNFCYVKGACKASKRAKTIYWISVAFHQESGSVLYANCQCPSGKSGYCNHIMAMLMELAEYSLLQLARIPEEVACTSRAREWGIPRSLTGRNTPILDVTVKKMKVDQFSTRVGIESTLYEARSANNRQNDNVAVKKLKNDLKDIDSHIGFACTIVPETETTKYVRTKFGMCPTGSVLSYQVSLTEDDFKVYCDLSAVKEISPEDEIAHYPAFPINDVDIFCDIQTSNMTREQVQLFETLKITDEGANLLEESTRDQAESELWRKQRRPRITASHVGDICIRKAQYENLAIRIYNPPPFSSFVQQKLKYGKMYEGIAREKYAKYLRNIARPVRVSESGLVINPNNHWLGCSPDGKVTDYMVDSPYGLCEVKCPHSKREEDLLVSCQQPSFFLYNHGGQPKLKESHPYYYQVQTQLALTGTEWADFVVYTQNSMVIQRISFDPNFWEQCIYKLRDFYVKYYLKIAAESFEDHA